MPRAVIAHIGGPDCGRERLIQSTGVLPELLASADGRERYHATGEHTGRKAHLYAWQAEHTGRKRPPCDRHNPLRPGCPGYQPKASTT